jgi:hypothetical protein
MEIKCLEIRDHHTFVPVICIRPVADNEEQRYLLRRDGYRADETERCIIMIDAQCRAVEYDPHHWHRRDRLNRTHRNAHKYIADHWHELKDGDVVDVAYILGETSQPKISERYGHPGIEVEDSSDSAVDGDVIEITYILGD